MKVATSVEKVWKIFDALRWHGSMGVCELAEHTKLLPSDAHRLLKSLEHFGFIEQNSESRKYGLGIELLKLGHVVHQRMQLREIARPHMRTLAQLADATANLAVLDLREMEVIFIEQVDCPGEFQVRLRIGQPVLPHATGVGKVLAAHLDRVKARQLFRKKGLVRKTRHTITEMSRMERELDRVLDQGYAIDREEGLDGACCVAAPVRDHTGSVVAALSISTIAQRMGHGDEPRLANLVRTGARRISAALGYQGDGARD